MAEELRAVTVSGGCRQFSLFPREVVRKLTRTRWQATAARLAEENRQQVDAQAHTGPKPGPEKEREYETSPDPKPR